MLKKTMCITLLAIFVLTLSACSILNRFYPDKRLQYQKAKSQPDLVLPEGMSSERIIDVMPVPPIPAALGNVPLPTELDRPAPLKVDLIRLGVQKRSAGERLWLFIDKSASQVWPDVDRYFQERHLPVAVSQAIDGLVESAWIPSANTEGSYINLLLQPDKENQDNTEDDKREEELKKISAYRFQMELQPGLQRNTSRLVILIDTKNMDEPGNAQPSTVEPAKETQSLWPKISASLLLENMILNDIANYLADSLEKTSSVSLLDQQMKREFEVTLVKEGQDQPFILINQDFNQSWYLVGKAIREAGLPLYDINRSLFLYYLSSEQDNDISKAFKKKLIDRKFKKILENHHDFQLLLIEEEGGVQVSVKLNDETFADKEFSLFILNELKQYIH